MDLEVYVPPSDTVALREADPTRQLVAGWLLAQTAANTREAYQRDIDAWLAYLAAHNVPPLAVVRGHADAWARQMGATPGRSGRPPSMATVNRRLASVSSFYDYCVSDGAIEVNRVKPAKRHRIDKRFSPTFRPTAEQALAILRAARDDGARSWALVVLLIFSGARVSEALGAQCGDLDYDGDERVLEVTRKGGAQAYLPLRPGWLVGGALDAYRHHRAGLAGVEPDDLTGPIFLDRHGRALTRQAAANLVSAIGARAGCPRLTPHGLRHAFATLGRLAGASKDDLQKWMGHLDSATTDRYIQRVKEYDSHPGQKIADLLGVREDGPHAA